MSLLPYSAHHIFITFSATLPLSLSYQRFKVQGFIYLALYNTGLYNEMQAVVPSCYTKTKQKNINYGGAWRMSWEVWQTVEKSCSVVWWYGSGYLCIACQTTTGWTDWGWGGYCLSLSPGLYAGIFPHWYYWCLVDGYQWCSRWFLSPAAEPSCPGPCNL